MFSQGQLSCLVFWGSKLLIIYEGFKTGIIEHRHFWPPQRMYYFSYFASVTNVFKLPNPNYYETWENNIF